MRREERRLYDEYLAAAARAGDRLALERLAERWQPRLLGHAWRLTGDGELARDVAQEAWVEILRGLAALDDAMAFPAWAMRIVTRRAAKAIGRRQRRRRAIDDLAHEPAPSSPVNRGEHDAEFQLVRAAMTELPSEQRSALGLFYLEEMSVAEIAVALDVPPGTVKTRLMHARRKLRRTMKGDTHAHHRRTDRGDPDGRGT